MSNLSVYAKMSDQSCQEICSKRALSLLFVCEYLRLAQSNVLVSISADYPPLAARFATLLNSIELPEYDKFWVFAACALLGECRRLGREPTMADFMSPKVLTEHMIDSLSV